MVKRRFSRAKNRYIIEDLDWIKEQIMKNYGLDMTREMLVHADKSDYGELGYIFFSINGSPPKGCAIYQPDHQFIIIIDAWGKSKKYRETIISEEIINKIKRDSRLWD